jgi:hypothetical protein
VAGNITVQFCGLTLKIYEIYMSIYYYNFYYLLF